MWSRELKLWMYDHSKPRSHEGNWNCTYEELEEELVEAEEEEEEEEEEAVGAAAKGRATSRPVNSFMSSTLL